MAHSSPVPQPRLPGSERLASARVDVRGKGQLPLTARRALGIESRATRLVVRIDPASPGTVVLEHPRRAVGRLRGQHAGVAAAFYRGAVPDVPNVLSLSEQLEQPVVVDAGVLALLLDHTALGEEVAELITAAIATHGARIAEWSLLELRTALLDLHRGIRDPVDALEDPELAAMADGAFGELAAIGVERVLPDLAQAAVQTSITALTAGLQLSVGETHTLALAATTGLPALLTRALPAEHPVLTRLGITQLPLCEPVPATPAATPMLDNAVPRAHVSHPDDTTKRHSDTPPVSTKDRPDDGAPEPFLDVLVHVLNVRWHSDTVPWTLIRDTASTRGARYPTRDAVSRAITEHLGEHAPQQQKTRTGWSYPTIELWAAVNSAYLRAGQAPAFNVKLDLLRKFVTFLAQSLATLDALGTPVEHYTQRAFVTTLRANDVAVPTHLVPRMWWILRNHADDARTWITALDAHATTS
ncbi:hypothetical protein [Amycolatopsis sp. NPDC059021]|uniref:hypothetical protein n=1 Tax=Amycolatopsis sp. NPDC059021 TaxID=3346704 RepID=UPI00366C3754